MKCILILSTLIAASLSEDAYSLSIGSPIGLVGDVDQVAQLGQVAQETKDAEHVPIASWGIQDYDGKDPKFYFGRFGLGQQKRNLFASGLKRPLTYELVQPIGYRPKVKEQVHEPLSRVF